VEIGPECVGQVQKRKISEFGSKRVVLDSEEAAGAGLGARPAGLLYRPM